MQKTLLLIGGALLSQTVMFSTFAQEPGVVTPVPALFHKSSPQEEASGKTHRKDEGRATSKAGVTGEVTAQPSPQGQDFEAGASGGPYGAADGNCARGKGRLAPVGEVDLV